jgi:hypothetical protein
MWLAQFGSSAGFRDVAANYSRLRGLRSTTSRFGGGGPTRTAAPDGWLWHYNHQRRHSALSHKPLIARLDERTNPLGTYS